MRTAAARRPYIYDVHIKGVGIGFSHLFQSIDLFFADRVKTLAIDSFFEGVINLWQVIHLPKHFMQRDMHYSKSGFLVGKKERVL